MIRTLRKPSNPEVLGRVIAALRVYSGQRRPKNAAEREIDAALKAQRVRPATAKRLVTTLDAMPKSARARLLDDIAKPGFAAPARAPKPMVPPLCVEIPIAALVRGSDALGVLSDILSADPGGEQLPLYTVRYQGLFCQKETDWDRGTSSDEVYAITSAVHIDPSGNNVVRTERHPQGQESYYGDMDTLDMRYGPVAATWQGYSEHPVSLTTVVFEHDEGDPDAYRDEIDVLVKAAIAVLGKLYPPAAVLALLQGTITDAVNWLAGTGDDIIASETVVLPRATLEFYASLHWSFYIGEKLKPILYGSFFAGYEVVPYVTDLPYHFLTVHRGSGAKYVVAYDVERRPAIERPVVLL